MYRVDGLFRQAPGEKLFWRAFAVLDPLPKNPW